jgi:hypothetical protein
MIRNAITLTDFGIAGGGFEETGADSFANREIAFSVRADLIGEAVGRCEWHSVLRADMIGLWRQNREWSRSVSASSRDQIGSMPWNLY